MHMTLLDRAALDLGLSEIPGVLHDPTIMRMLTLDASWPEADEVPWCAAAVNWWCWNLGLERTKSLRARAFLECGREIWTKSPAANALPHYDAIELVQPGAVIIFARGKWRPPASVIKAPGHVAVATGKVNETRTKLEVIGGNQGDKVSKRMYASSSMLGIRRLRFDQSNRYEA